MGADLPIGADIPGVPLPAFVQIEPVGRCNLRCQMCPVQFRPDAPPATLDFETYRGLVDSFEDLTELHLQGLGEPLMHPRFFDMVRYAAARGVRVSTNTNLTLLTAARAQQAVSSGLHEISASIDAASARTYESIRIGARLSRVVRNLRRLIQARTLAGGKLPHVRIVMVLMRRTLPELIGMVELAHATGVDALFVQRLCHDFAESTLPPAYRSMREFVDAEALVSADAVRTEEVFVQARNRAAALGVTLRLPRVEPRPATGNWLRCDWPWRGAYLSYRGEAMPCCMVATPDRANLGNMASAGVRAVWDGETYTRFRNALASGTPPEICSTCTVYRGTF